MLTDVTASRNGVHGLDLEAASAATIMRSFTASSNRVFGINVNGRSMTFVGANVTVSGNALGIQVATHGG